MIISFLQRRNPPILPSLQKMPNDKRSTVDGKLSAFGDDVESIRGCGKDNKESLAELLFAFFLHYGYEFPYSTSVVSVKEGRMMSRREKGWDNVAVNKEARCRLCVEEPFNTERNLGNSADDYAWNGIHNEIRRAFNLLADGCQLEKCCEQFEFPPDPEKTPFQRPTPKPKPTLTRSASQSGSRQNQEPSSNTRKKGGNRNQSAQRSGNRRASSGSAFNNQRGVYVQSPPGGVNAVDYFATKSNLHDHLYQQYQFLQAQQDALRSQLVAQQQNHQQAAHRAGDLAGVGSSHIRTQFANGAIGSPRYSSIDAAPQTAPLFPGYLLSYPPRFVQAALTQQNQRSREGTNTNPSSPSLVAAVPALRRQGQRASESLPSTSSIRSQSQPGRSFPHPLLVHQLAQQGYDMQALGLGSAYQNMRSPQNFGHVHQAPMQMPFPAAQNIQNGNNDTAMPKEYVGYYVGQSPQLGPQHGTANQISVPAMPALRDPPQRQRRVTPDLMPPTTNGRHLSRSPSPLSHPRGPTVADSGASRAQGPAYSSSSYDSSPAPEYVHTQVAGDGGPIIVNGSNPPPQPRQGLNGFSKSPLAHASESMYTHVLPLRTTDFDVHAADVRTDRRPSSPAISPTTCRTSNQRLPQISNGHASAQNETILDTLPLSAAPLLSPVVELRTPSPSKNFDTFDSPQQAQINGIVKASKLANAKQVQRDENEKPRFPDARNERRTTPAGLGIGNGSSARQAATKSSALQQFQQNIVNGNGQRNEWQPAPGRKSHKKNKSSYSGQPRSPRAHGGEPLPANENERKGG
jgi:hypothetical protein